MRAKSSSVRVAADYFKANPHDLDDSPVHSSMAEITDVDHRNLHLTEPDGG
jgi:hypothetical protein